MFKVMYRVNPNYSERNVETVTFDDDIQVTEYPEHKLPFLALPSDCPDDAPSICIMNDVYDLFNQQRIQALGSGVVDYVKSMMPAPSPISDDMSKMSDDQILDAIKPRSVQSPSELRSWIKYNGERINEAINNKLAADKAAADKAAAEKAAVVEPSKTD